MTKCAGRPVSLWAGAGDDANHDLWVVVLAGGQGLRLREFIQTVLEGNRPKQFCRIIGTRSMLRHTWDRARCLVPEQRIVTVVTAGQERYLADEVRDGLPGRVLVQPANRETAPGLLLPLLWIARRAPRAMVAVFPADHFIWEEARFLEAVGSAVAAGRSHQERVILLGMEAQAPETSYGWIAPGPPVAEGSGDDDLFSVQGFWEKPPLERARQLRAAGCFWNSLVMAGRLPAFLGLMEAHLPEPLEILREASTRFDTAAEPAAMTLAYQRLRPADFSREVLQPGREGLLVRPARGVTWCDWGRPERILRTVHQFDRQPCWLPGLLKSGFASREWFATASCATPAAGGEV
ncbi:MAG TPA: sugar phosphate nucleotidyltransferase [Candidatus Methylomirabilis sp.]|nr:sugar phosphate nucleotidyltransferase [Candidatus Methylomirabilis sp.]